MSQKFRVGDRIICTNTDGQEKYLTVGKIYTVTKLGEYSREYPYMIMDTGEELWSSTATFEKVQDTITVTLPIGDAKSYAKQYPDSKYLAPALAEATKAQFPEVPFCLGVIDPSTLPDKSVFVYNDTVRVRESSRDSANYIGCEVIGASYPSEGFHRTSMVAKYSQVVFIPEKAKISAPDEITFEMPLDVARKFNDCTIAPLVKAWDKDNAPKSELLVWLEEMQPGMAFRKVYIETTSDHTEIRGGNLFLKRGSKIVAISNADGTEVNGWSLDHFANEFQHLRPFDLTIL